MRELKCVGNVEVEATISDTMTHTLINLNLPVLSIHQIITQRTHLLPLSFSLSPSRHCLPLLLFFVAEKFHRALSDASLRTDQL